MTLPCRIGLGEAIPRPQIRRRSFFVCNSSIELSPFKLKEEMLSPLAPTSLASNPILGQRKRPCFVFEYRARQKNCSSLTFQEEFEGSTVENRFMAIPPDKAIIPPDTPFVLKWRKAGGRVGT